MRLKHCVHQCFFTTCLTSREPYRNSLGAQILAGHSCVTPPKHYHWQLRGEFPPLQLLPTQTSVDLREAVLDDVDMSLPASGSASTPLRRLALHSTTTCATQASEYGKCILKTYTDVRKDACKEEFAKFGACLRTAVR